MPAEELKEQSIDAPDRRVVAVLQTAGYVSHVATTAGGTTRAGFRVTTLYVESFRGRQGIVEVEHLPREDNPFPHVRAYHTALLADPRCAGLRIRDLVRGFPVGWPTLWIWADA